MNVATTSAPVCAAVQRCRVCGCTDNDCSGCIARTGAPCSWVESDLCSACVPAPAAAIEEAAALAPDDEEIEVPVALRLAPIHLAPNGTRFLNRADRILFANHGRRQLRCDVGEVRQDWGALQSAAAGARISGSLRMPHAFREGFPEFNKALRPMEPTAVPESFSTLQITTNGAAPLVSVHDLPLGQPSAD